MVAAHVTLRPQSSRCASELDTPLHGCACANDLIDNADQGAHCEQCEWAGTNQAAFGIQPVIMLSVCLCFAGLGAHCAFGLQGG